MSTETIRVTLPAETVEQYTMQAKSRGDFPPEWLMAERLRLFAGTNSQKPLVIDDASRQQIEKMFNKNINSAVELVRLIEQAVSVRVDDMGVSFSPQLLSRLNSRCIGMDFDKFLPQLIKRLLEEYVGLR